MFFYMYESTPTYVEMFWKECDWGVDGQNEVYIFKIVFLLVYALFFIEKISVL